MRGERYRGRAAVVATGLELSAEQPVSVSISDP